MAPSKYWLKIRHCTQGFCFFHIIVFNKRWRQLTLDKFYSHFSSLATIITFNITLTRYESIKSKSSCENFPLFFFFIIYFFYYIGNYYVQCIVLLRRNVTFLEDLLLDFTNYVCKHRFRNVILHGVIKEVKCKVFIKKNHQINQRKFGEDERSYLYHF